MSLARSRRAPLSLSAAGAALQRTLLALIAAAICCFATLPAHAEARVAVVDLRRAMLDLRGRSRALVVVQRGRGRYPVTIRLSREALRQRRQRRRRGTAGSRSSSKTRPCAPGPRRGRA